jgi:hypothetical protein
MENEITEKVAGGLLTSRTEETNNKFTTFAS